MGITAAVTGGTFGVGRGVASVLAETGMTGYVTGRSVDPEGNSEGGIHRLRCDHRVDEETASVYARIERETCGADHGRAGP